MEMFSIPLTQHPYYEPDNRIIINLDVERIVRDRTGMGTATGWDMELDNKLNFFS